MIHEWESHKVKDPSQTLFFVIPTISTACLLWRLTNTLLLIHLASLSFVQIQLVLSTWRFLLSSLSVKHNNNTLYVLCILCRRTSQMWQRSCQRRTLRRVVTISPTPKAQKTTAVPLHRRAGEEDGCEEVPYHKLELVYRCRKYCPFLERAALWYQRGRASFPVQKSFR